MLLIHLERELERLKSLNDADHFDSEIAKLTSKK